MTIPLQVSFQELETSEAVRIRIEEKLAKLERFHDRILSCRVVISSPHRHARKGSRFEVKVDIALPGGELVAHRATDPDGGDDDVYVAIRDAFDALERQLKDHVVKTRDH